MTSQIKDRGKQSRVTKVYRMESKADDTLKDRFLEVRKEIYNRYTDKQQKQEDQPHGLNDPEALS
jgi:hypothetical protein